MNAITVKDVIKWQNEIMAYRNEKGKPYSPTYLKTIHNQFSAIFNHAIKYYDFEKQSRYKSRKYGR